MNKAGEDIAVLVEALNKAGEDIAVLVEALNKAGKDIAVLVKALIKAGVDNAVLTEALNQAGIDIAGLTEAQNKVAHTMVIAAAQEQEKKKAYSDRLDRLFQILEDNIHQLTQYICDYARLMYQEARDTMPTYGRLAVDKNQATLDANMKVMAATLMQMPIENICDINHAHYVFTKCQELFPS